MEFDLVVHRRGMVRAFRPDPIDERTLQTVLTHARQAPSAGFTQPLEIVVVRDVRVKRALIAAAWEQGWAGASPVVLVVCADTRRSGAAYGERGIRRYAIIDAAFASLLILLSAVNEGLGACFVGAFDDDRVRSVLGLPAHVLPVGIIPVGVPAERPPRRRRRSLSELVHADRWSDQRWHGTGPPRGK